MKDDKSYYTRIKNGLKNTVNSIFWVIAIVVVTSVIYILSNKYFESIKPKTWTLFIYNNPIPDTEKQDTRIDGYKSKTDCLEKGVLLVNKNQSFECASDCKYKENNYYFEVCDEVCNRNGCR